MDKTITVGIPFYNCERTLADTLRSVFAQTTPNWRIILLNDGSTDDSLGVAKSVHDDRIEVVSDGSNKGIGFRRKQIVEMCQTQYLAWQDADDFMHPNRLALQLQYLEEHSEIDLVDNYTYLMDMQGQIFAMVQRPQITGEYRKKVVKAPFMLNGSTLGKIEMYRKYPFDPSFRRSEDWEMWCRAVATSKFGRIAQPLYFRRCMTENGQIHWLKSLKDIGYSRKILLMHGPPALGWLGTFAKIGEQYTRDVLRSLVCIAGLQCILPRNRNSQIKHEDFSSAQRIVEEILKAELP